MNSTTNDHINNPDAFGNSPKPISLSAYEVLSLRKIEEKWYEWHYSIIYQPPGEVPQTKGAWTDPKWVVDMLADLKKHQPQGTKLMVAWSRCGEIGVQDADEWLQMREVERECWDEQEAYIKAGKCSLCGACSLKEAETKCRPQSLGDTGDFTCPGEDLWRDEEGQEKTSDEEEQP